MTDFRAPPSRTAWSYWIAAAAALVAFGLLAYGSVLDNFFNEMDDPSLLWSAMTGRPVLLHFRPLQAVLDRLLLALSGPEPRLFYASGLLLHLVNAGLLGLLLVRLGTARGPALMATIVFVTYFAPHETVLWVSAYSLLLCAFFALLALHFELSYLSHAGFLAWGGLVLSFLGAQGSREDAVLLFPALLLVHGSIRGWSDLFSRRALRLHGVLLLLYATYLALAFRPSHWAEQGGVGKYALDMSAVPRLLRSLAAMLWPGTGPADHPRPWLWIAGGLECALLVLGFRVWGRRPLYRLGCWLLVGGLLPALPGPFTVLKGRFTYMSTIGLACLAALVFEALGASIRRTLVVPRLRRAAYLLGIAGVMLFCLLEGLAIRSVEGWRFQPRCERLETLVGSTGEQIARGESDPIVVVSPFCWSALAYAHALEVFLGLPHERVTLTALPFDQRLEASFVAGAPLDPGRHRLFYSEPDGRIVRLASGAVLPRGAWEACARHREALGLGLTLALVTIRPP